MHPINITKWYCCLLLCLYRMLSSFINTRKEKIWQAVCSDDIKTIARLLPQATTEDLQYESKVIMYFIYSVFSL